MMRLDHRIVDVNRSRPGPPDQVATRVDGTPRGDRWTTHDGDLPARLVGGASSAARVDRPSRRSPWRPDAPRVIRVGRTIREQHTTTYDVGRGEHRLAIELGSVGHKPADAERVRDRLRGVVSAHGV
ncbi:MAG: hypothetical protein AB8G26_20220, partial [Ilumatobacter sp.]